MLSAELDDHLESGSAEGAINRRNGSSRKTMLTGTSKVTLDVPRDRAGMFDPKLIANIVSIFARGMTVREIR
jgi:putative transposase